jgi:hypothetical protein
LILKKILCISPLFICLGCNLDDGYINPKQPPKPTLGIFSGRANNEGDTTLSAKRLLNLSDPQVTLVWKFLGPKEFTITPGNGAVNATPPYAFNIKLLDPPSREVLENPDLAVGSFWLFSDRNGNGMLDRLIHPEMLEASRVIDSLYRIYQATLVELANIGEVKATRVDVVETYHVGKFGTVTLGSSGDEDTLFLGHTPADTAFLEYLFNSRFRTLTYQNKWERFFTGRKRDNDYYRIFRPSQEHVFDVDMPIKRKLFPKPGNRHEFERKMRHLTAVFNDYIHIAENMISYQMSLGHHEYPYDGFDEPGADWVAGRSRNSFIVYIKDESELQELREAEKSSSFTAKGIEKVQTGYNAIRCDDQYNCEFLESEADMTIDLGQTEEYFNPPPSAIRKPGKMELPADTIGSGLERFAGVYDFEPFYPVRIASKEGRLWAQIPDEGVLRLAAVDSLLFRAFDRDLRIQFVQDYRGQPYKLFIYKGTKKFVATRDSTLGVADLTQWVEAMLAPAVPFDPARAHMLTASRYAYGADTLQVQWSKDSLRADIPGILSGALVPGDSLSFFSRVSDFRLAFDLDAQGKCAGAKVSLAGKTVLAPALDYAPLAPADLFPGIADSLPQTASQHGGSGRDGFFALDGGPRYVAGQDSLFLKAGDSWVDTLSSPDPTDSLSLRQGGDFLRFRIQGQLNKAIAIELTFCPQRGVKGRVRLSLRGSADRSRQDDTLGGDFWIEMDRAPVTVKLGPWKVSADPYFVRVGQIATADSPFRYSFDHYRILAE